MQKYAHLIQKLQFDFANNVSTQQLYATVLQLQQDLQKDLTSPTINSTSKVSVVLPNCYIPKTVETTVTINKETLNEKEATPKVNVAEEFSNNKLKNEIETPVEITEKPTMVLVSQDDDDDDDDIISLMPSKTLNINKKAIAIPKTGVLLYNDIDTDIETLDGTSLLFESDKLTDLKKAISLHEKFVFISELFRGDDSNYDRSIRTIQNFNSFNEANNWITKELVTKEGWKNENETVTQFMNLVKRRFAS